MRGGPDERSGPWPPDRGSPQADADPTVALAADVDRAFREAHSAVELLLNAAAVRLGINRTDLRCLEVLDRVGAQTAGALADAVQLSPAAVTKVVDRLVAIDYVERVRDGDDRRRVMIRTTDQERAAQRDVFAPLVADGIRMLSHYTDDELRFLRSALEATSALNRRHTERLAAQSDDHVSMPASPLDD